MKRILFGFALAGLGLISGGGCAHHEPGPYLPQGATNHNLEDTAQIVLFDPGAANSVTCGGIQQERLSDGRLQVAANLRNRENRRIQVQLNCVFKDGQGFVVEETPFQNFFLDEYAQEGVKFVSLNDKAQRYTIRVREAR